MTDLFRDVDEALQRERAARLWKEYGPVLVIGAVLLILATGAFSAYRAWSTEQKREATAQLVAAAEDKNPAPKLEQLAADSKGGYRIVALMNGAGKEADAGQFDKAAALYLKAADDDSAPGELRDLANIYYVRAVQLRESEADIDYQSLAARLDPIATNDKSPFMLQAKLDAALIHGDTLKNPAKALTMLDGFDAKNVPDSLKEKAAALTHVFSYEQAAQNKAPASKE